MNAAEAKSLQVIVPKTSAPSQLDGTVHMYCALKQKEDRQRGSGSISKKKLVRVFTFVVEGRFFLYDLLFRTCSICTNGQKCC